MTASVARVHICIICTRAGTNEVTATRTARNPALDSDAIVRAQGSNSGAIQSRIMRRSVRRWIWCIGNNQTRSQRRKMESEKMTRSRTKQTGRQSRRGSGAEAPPPHRRALPTSHTESRRHALLTTALSPKPSARRRRTTSSANAPPPTVRSISRSRDAADRMMRPTALRHIQSTVNVVAPGPPPAPASLAASVPSTEWQYCVTAIPHASDCDAVEAVPSSIVSRITRRHAWSTVHAAPSLKSVLLSGRFTCNQEMQSQTNAHSMTPRFPVRAPLLIRRRPGEAGVRWRAAGGSRSLPVEAASASTAAEAPIAATPSSAPRPRPSRGRG